MGGGKTRVAARVHGEGADLPELEELAASLRDEFLDLDVDAVEVPQTGPPPPGAKGGGLAEVGALVLSVASPEVLAAVVSAAGGWLAGHRRRSVKLEVDGDVLELTGVSSREQRRLADEWLQRRADG